LFRSRGILLEEIASNWDAVVAPGRVELPTFGLGNRCSIHLSYGASAGDNFTLRLRFSVPPNSHKKVRAEDYLARTVADSSRDFPQLDLYTVDLSTVN
jgi:hypothetical protein